MADTKEKEAVQAQKKIDASSVIDSVQLNVEAYLGGTNISIADLNDLSQDQVIELDATLNQSVELRLNGVAVATGELVAVGDNFGVKITGLPG